MTDNHLVNRFLESFQNDVRNNISIFCKTLWESDYDIYIFMARKAACFFDCLRDLGIAQVRGLALNDRVLEMDLSFIKDKKVLLVDDCIFSGTTLYSARNAIIKAGCSKFGTHTLAINEDWIRPQLLPGGEEWDDLRIIDPVFRMSNSDCVRQCHDIVRAISILPRPYDVDFPHTKTVKIKASSFDQIVNLPGWQAIECASDFQKRNGVRAFSIIPHSYSAKNFWHSHGSDCRKGRYTKIRVYARYLDHANSYLVRFMPVVMLPEIKNKLVTEAITNFFKTETAISELGLITPFSRYRFLHFVAANSLLEFYEKSTETILPENSFEIRKDLVEMTFGTSFWDQYAEIKTQLSDLQIPSEDQATSECTANCLNDKKQIQSDAEIISRAIEPFQELYIEKELAARKYVRDNGLNYVSQNPFPHSKRLLEGVTPTQLCDGITSNYFDTQVTVSVLLDRLIDAGVAVPIVEDTGMHCKRAFRHGEDAVLGEAEERALLQAIQSYIKCTDKDFMWGLELQKLIVLVTQIAVRRGFFSSLKLNTPISSSTRLISIKGHLHGAVPIIVSPSRAGDVGVPYVDGTHNRPRWLAHDWVEKGFLSQVSFSNGSQYKVKTLPKLSIGKKSDAQARQIGRCLGKAVASGAIDSNYNFIVSVKG
ncbi:MAG: phosphoribosyltransferase [Alphaproteobacteria bacterium]